MDGHRSGQRDDILRADTLDATGEGPFAIYYRPYTRRTTEVLALQDPYDHGGAFIYEPYELVVVGAGLTLLTVVSPDDADDFTTTIIEGLLAEATPSSSLDQGTSGRRT